MRPYKAFNRSLTALAIAWACGFSVQAVGQQQADSATFNATAELVTAINITCVGDLDFGTVFRHIGAELDTGTVVVDAAQGAEAEPGTAGNRIAGVIGGSSVACTVSNLEDAATADVSLSGASGTWNSGDGKLAGITLALEGDGEGELNADVNVSTTSLDDEEEGGTTFYIGGLLTIPATGADADGQYTTSEPITVTVAVD